jgi:MFS family permease
MLEQPRAVKLSPPWLILGLLLGAVVISFIDRQVLGILVDPIRTSMGLSDFQIGIIGGPAFFVLYFIGGILGGWAVDRYKRTGVIALAIVLWSMTTAACGLSANFVQILLARMGVGFGEGVLGPGIHSVIADSFDKKRLPMAMSYYTAANAVGSGVSLFIGGLILQWASNKTWQLPVLGTVHPWQLTFMAVSLPGLLLAPAIWGLIHTPPREAHPAYGKQGLFGDVVDFGKKRLRLVTLYTVGIGSLTGAKLSFALWIPTLLMRIYKQPPAEVGATLGVMFLALGIIGSLFWGGVATYLAKRGREDAAMITIVGAVGVFALLVFIPPLMPTPFLLLLTFAPCLLFVQSYLGLGHAAVQLVTPSRLRGRVSGLFNGTVNIIAVVVGPTGIGAVSTYFFADDQKLGQSIALMTGTMSLLGFFCLLAAIKPYREAQALLALEAERGATVYMD